METTMETKMKAAETASPPMTTEQPAPLRVQKPPQTPRLKLFQPHEATKHPVLRFTPYAWAKLYFLCHFGDTEIGAFGIANVRDRLLIEDLALVKQQATAVTVKFDDDSVADFFDSQVDQGRKPEWFARCWCHTHPGASPNPSAVDEETFARVFGTCDWAVMFILARSGKSYARLRFNVGPGGETVIPVEVDYDRSFPGSNLEAWATEYEKYVMPGLYPDDLTGLGPVDDPVRWPFAFGADEFTPFMEGGPDAF